MALKPTIYKCQIELADTDRGHYESLALTLARHPSETIERLAARLLAYCLNHGPGLAFTRGLSSGDEPDIWRHSESGEITQWIEVGQPEPARLRKACGRAPQVAVYAYGKSTDTWWEKQGADIAALPGLIAWQFPWTAIEAVGRQLDRQSKLMVSVAGEIIYVDNGSSSASLEPRRLAG